MTVGTSEPSIGRRIAAFRKARGFRTARDLAEAIGTDLITEAVIQNIEAGRKADLSVSQLLNIARALRVSPAFLLAPLGRPFDRLDLPGLSEDLSNMSVKTFFAWLSGEPFGPYRGEADEELERFYLNLQVQGFEREHERNSVLQAINRLATEAVGEGSENELRAAQIEQLERRIPNLTDEIDRLEDQLIQAGWYGQSDRRRPHVVSLQLDLEEE